MVMTIITKLKPRRDELVFTQPSTLMSSAHEIQSVYATNQSLNLTDVTFSAKNSLQTVTSSDL